MRGGQSFVAAAAGLALASMLLVSASTAVAAPGDLDTSFGQSGLATVDLHHNAGVAGLTVQQDGRVVVVGTAISPSGATTDLVTARFTAQGAIDTSFNGNGVIQPDFDQNETASATLIQPDGKILLAGDSTPASGVSSLLVARFNADGAPDASFGGGTGRSIQPFGSHVSMFVRGLALAPDGKIVAGGWDGVGSIPLSAVARLNTNGSPDPGFGGSGLALHSTVAANDKLNAVALVPDGSIVGAGQSFLGGASGNFFVEQLTHTNDPQALSHASFTVDLGGNDAATSLAMLPNGKMLLGGYTDTNGTFDFAVVRLNSDRSLDSSFGNGGKEVVDLGGSDTAEAMVLQPDGKIVLVGNTTSGGNARIGVARLLPGGQPDTTFGQNGVSVIGLGAAAVQGRAVGLQQNGDIVIGGAIKQAGSSQRDLLVVRVHGDAATAGSGGATTTTTTTTGNGSTITSVSHPGLRVTNVSGTTLKVGSGLPALNPAKTLKNGLLVTFSSTGSAKLTFKLTLAQPGRLSTGRCRALGKGAPPSGHRCTLRTTVTTLRFSGQSGVNRFAFYGRLTNGTALKPGSYTLTIGAGSGSAQVTATPLAFQITSK